MLLDSEPVKECRPQILSWFLHVPRRVQVSYRTHAQPHSLHFQNIGVRQVPSHEQGRKNPHTFTCQAKQRHNDDSKQKYGRSGHRDHILDQENEHRVDPIEYERIVAKDKQEQGQQGRDPI